MTDIKSFIRTIPHHPKQGIMFRDITTLLKDPKGLQLLVDGLAEQYANQKIDKIVGIEARGFVIGAAVAYKLGVGFVPIRKSGKLPAQTIQQEYALEYGTDVMEIHQDAIAKSEQVLLVDDLIATGGTAMTAVSLINQLGGNIVGCAFVIDLPDKGGANILLAKGLKVFSLCQFNGE
ncbi:MAG: adenine phosphoribosyltransferase [Methylophilaceae bacterium 17-44-8]|nr:MAG: adenine phosphoribosyltransferase [Methylophilales bacterium 28-44-11]OYZ09228.1 MAG: adenine phosphoribosyltransferase [Methylophilales bacterium 16-45-7]OZA05800.1 MAG: adenine phosphoribosyltransferase [Methylophilaceae bacterium 17-44-8]